MWSPQYLCPSAVWSLPVPFPSELHNYVVFTAGVGSAVKQPDAAEALIKHLTAPNAVPVIKAKGIEPVAQ